MKSILITSISNKVPLINAVIKAGEGKNIVIGADVHPMCVGQYFVDTFWHCPPLEKWTPEGMLEKCQKEKIFAIIPTRDEDVEFFAHHKAFFKENGISALVSDYEGVKVCNDKMRFYQTMSTLDLPVIPTSAVLDELDAERYVVKEKFGAGSLNISLDLDYDQAQKHARTFTAPIYQPHIVGQEYSIDLFVAESGRIMGVVARSRDCIVRGESQVTTTLRDQALEDLAAAVVTRAGLKGHLLLQVIRDTEGRDHIVECNARFGGASTLSLAMGLESFKWFLAEARGEELDTYHFKRSTKEMRLIRFSQDMIQCHEPTPV